MLLHLMNHESDGVQGAGIMDEVKDVEHIFELPSVRIQTLFGSVQLFDEYDVLKLLARLQRWCWRS